MKRWLRLHFHLHDWQTYQHCVRADENEKVFVICFKICKVCATSRLVHLLE